MALFVLTYFALYGCIHFYIFLRLKPLIVGESRFSRRLFAVFLLVMIVEPIGARLAEKKGFADLSAIIAWGGYLWMGYAFILIVFLGIADIFMVLSKFRQRLSNRNSNGGCNENDSLAYCCGSWTSDCRLRGYRFCT